MTGCGSGMTGCGSGMTGCGSGMTGCGSGMIGCGSGVTGCGSDCTCGAALRCAAMGGGRTGAGWLTTGSSPLGAAGLASVRNTQAVRERFL